MKSLLRKIGKYGRVILGRTAPIMILSVVLIGVLFPHTALALSDEVNDALMKFQEIINTGFGLVHAVFWPILLMMGSLMDNDLIFGPGIGERLREIWVIIRNMVNIAFVLLLLVIAFYNVTGLGGEGNFALKTALPKFVMALIAVNFSFLACKVILDAANVVSIAVYDIAGSVEQYDAGEIRETMEFSICNSTSYISCASKVEVDVGLITALETAVDAGGSTETEENALDDARQVAIQEACGEDSGGWEYKNASPIAKAFCVSSEKGSTAECTTLKGESYTTKEATTEDDRQICPAFSEAGTSFFKQLDQNNIGIIMAINLGGLNQLTDISASGLKGNAIKDLAINTLFSILMYIVFGFAYIALFVVLLARLVVLWLVIALSPLIALTMVVPQINQYASELNLSEKFTQHLLAPIIIGLSMSIGFLMTDKIKNQGAGGINMGGYGDTSFTALSDGSSAGTFLAPNVSDLQQLMIACIAVAVVWMGVFGAADKTIASSVTSPIKDFGTKAAKFLAKLPTYAPIVPIMTKEGENAKPYSFTEITSVMKDITNLPEEWAQGRARKLAQDLNIRPSTSEAFESALKAYKDAVKTDKPAKARGILQSNLATSAEYEKFKAQATADGVQGMPEDFNNFESWYKRDGYTKFNTAYDTNVFTSDDYKRSSTSSGSPDASKTQIVNVFAEGDVGSNKTEAVAKMKEVGTTGNPAGTDQDANLQAIADAIANITDKTEQGKAIDKLKFDKEGRLEIAVSMTALGLTPTPPADGSGDSAT